MNKKKTKPEVLIIDVDGVLTTGHFIYSSRGKVMKIFGKDDSDGLNLLKPYLSLKNEQSHANNFGFFFNFLVNAYNVVNSQVPKTSKDL